MMAQTHREGDAMATTVLTRAELETTSAELLPARETLAWINITNVAAVNIAIAINAASVGSVATAVALQGVSSSQS
jgi:hypothetical protein